MIYNRPEYWLAKTETAVTYLTFSSPSSFTLAVGDATKHWDGTLEYSTNTSTWSTWDGTTTLSSATNGSDNVLYLRGTGNTKIGYYDEVDTEEYIPWTINGTDVRCDGNIETLLDYATVEAGEHPTMAEYCFGGLFMGCTALITPPELPATTLADYCYEEMFKGCTSLTQAPALPATTLAYQCYNRIFQGCTSLTQVPTLPATTLAESCYSSMFKGCTALTQIPALPATALKLWCYDSMFLGCTGLKLSDTQTGEYTQEYRIPSFGTGTTAGDTLTNMFTNTSGTFRRTPSINTTYYLSNTNTVV